MATAALVGLAACATQPQRVRSGSGAPLSPITATMPRAEAAAGEAEATPPPPPRRPSEQPEPNHREPPETELNAFGDRVPVRFTLAPMLEAALEPAQRASAEARILAWMIQIDDRPLLVEYALLWIRVAPKNAAPTYRLVNLFRHPLDDDRDRREQWRLWRRSHAPPGVRSFAAPPTLRELDDFTGFTDWDYDASDGFDLVDGQVCAGAWRKSFGSAPGRAFPSPHAADRAAPP